MENQNNEKKIFKRIKNDPQVWIEFRLLEGSNETEPAFFRLPLSPFAGRWFGSDVAYGAPPYSARLGGDRGYPRPRGRN